MKLNQLDKYQETRTSCIIMIMYLCTTFTDILVEIFGNKEFNYANADRNRSFSKLFSNVQIDSRAELVVIYIISDNYHLAGDYLYGIEMARWSERLSDDEHGH